MKMSYTINIALAISFIIGTAIQAVMFVASIILKKQANEALEKAKIMSEEANSIVAEAEKNQEGSMMCLEMANELSLCHSKDERTNVIIKWIPKLQEVGFNISNIEEIINN